MLGLAGKALSSANYQGGPINPNRVRNAKSRNITLVYQFLRWHEWNKTQSKRPSLPPIAKYIGALIM